ncbi:MAG: nitronate monooxygenase [Lachnospiraceae bacterium]|nr:nitronate monooxygenase [Lachnospiraceae bacterium]
MVKLRDKILPIPLIQGGMGVGISLGRLAGSVAKCGAMGVISSVNAGFDEPDFDTDPMAANLRALEREIKKAKEIAAGNGLVGVNIMTAVTHYKETCLCAVRAGADAIISGAGLPLKLAEYVKGSDTLFAPIVSSGRAAKLLLKHYQKRFDMRPDFFVIEGSRAGGHLGFSKEELLEDTAKSNEEILAETLPIVGDIPVFVGGGVFDHQDMERLMDAGAAGVQIGTRFIATEECDADPGFKQAIVDAKEDDALIIQSPVGMPARAVNSPLLKRLAEGERYPAVRCNNCLEACPKGDKTPYCISRALVAAVKGNWKDGLFFTGGNVGRVNKIVPVKELIEDIIGEPLPAPQGA